MPFGSYLSSIPTDDAILASGLTGALGFALLLFVAAVFLGALASPHLEG